jgi:Cu(I)/Ag(I) efflux system membrane fusion protein
MDLIDLKTKTVKHVSLFKEIRTVGVIAYDPVLVVAEEEFLAALRARDKVLKSDIAQVRESAETLLNSSRRKLMILGVSESEISKLEEERRVHSNLLLPEEKMWVYANIYEQDLEWVQMGLGVTVRSVAAPGRDFRGVIKAVEPILDAKTRTAKVRIEVDNFNLILKPKMYVDVYVKTKPKYVLAVPKEAVLDTGLRKIAYVDKGEGHFVKVELMTGVEGVVLIDGKKRPFLVILSGLKKGDVVVTSANFLIDSESQITGGSSNLYGGAKEIKGDRHD